MKRRVDPLTYKKSHDMVMSMNFNDEQIALISDPNLMQKVTAAEKDKLTDRDFYDNDLPLVEAYYKKVLNRIASQRLMVLLI
mmetsp:Transcript_15388/g.26006  ORF Transcript_15388/g.26006 Transcript_15388/m.26006 type:complete len:82 (-) Transcript_15388:76-321(-)